MAVGLQKPVRRALLTLLKADSDLLELVPAASINPVGEPAWPFIRLRSPVTQPRRNSCSRGGDVSWDGHVFAGPRKEAGLVVETAEDHAGSIGAHFERILHDNRLALEDGSEARIRLSDIRLIEDGDPDHYHWFCQINARVLAE